MFWRIFGRRRDEWGYGKLDASTAAVGDKSQITSQKEVKLPNGRVYYVTHVETDLPASWLKQKQR